MGETRKYTITGGDESETITGCAGNDFLSRNYCGGSIDNISDNYVVTGGSGNNILYGENGDDSIICGL